VSLPNSPQLNIQHQPRNTGEVDRHSVADIPELEIVDDLVLPTVCPGKGYCIRYVRIGCNTDVCALDITPASDIWLVGKGRDDKAEDGRAVAVRIA
jgi:hypothetical protein